MSKVRRPRKGHTYRFSLGGENEGFGLCFSLWLPGKADPKKARREARSLLVAADAAEGCHINLPTENLYSARLYLYASSIPTTCIVDVYPETQ